jgi:hypothetical protein
MNLAGRYTEAFFLQAFSSFFPVLPVFPVVLLLNPRLGFTDRSATNIGLDFKERQ